MSLVQSSKQCLFGFSAFFVMYLGYLESYLWMQFLTSTILILTLCRFYYGQEFLTYIGLKASKKDCFKTFFLVLFLSITAYFIVIGILSSEKYEDYFLRFSHPLDYILITPFQTLNEEIVFRALLLGALGRWGIKDRWLILVPAIAFSLLHWVMYRYNLLESNRGTLTPIALLTILCFGIAANALYLHFKNILYPWAIHCAWNLNRFGHEIYDRKAPETEIQEYLTFNIFEGSPSVLFISTVLASFSLWIFFRGKTQSKESF